MSKKVAKKDRALELLNAAESLLFEGGTGALSAKAIADRAGLNKALVFYYWDSVDDLVGAVLKRYYERHAEALSEAFAVEEPDTRVALHRTVDMYFDWISENKSYARVVQQQVASRSVHEALVSKHLSEMLKSVEGLLGDKIPKAGPTSAKHFFLSFSAMVINTFTYAPLLKRRFPLAERREHLHFTIDAWMDALGI